MPEFMQEKVPACGSRSRGPAAVAQLTAGACVWCRGGVIVVAVAASTFVAEPHARADEPPHYRVEFSTDARVPQCNRPLTFEALLRMQVPLEWLSPPISWKLGVHIGPGRGGGYLVDVTIEDGSGKAVLPPDHNEYPAEVCCYEVLFNTAFASAVKMGAYKPKERETPPAPPPVPVAPCSAEQPAPAAPPPGRRPRTVPQQTTAPSVALPASRAMQWQIGLGGMFVIGVAPEVLPGVQGAVALRGPLWSVELDGRWTPWVETRPAGSTIIEMTTVTAALVPCFRPGPFAFCGLVTGGWRGATAINRDFPIAEGQALFSGGGRVSYERAISGRFTLRLDADGAVAITRPVIGIRGNPLDWLPAPLNATFSAWVFSSF